MPFYFFFGLLGLVVGGLVTWFVLANHPFESLETPGGPVDEVEASHLAAMMAREGMPVDEATVVRLLELHGAYVDGREDDAAATTEAAGPVLQGREAGDAAAEVNVKVPPAGDSAQTR